MTKKEMQILKQEYKNIVFNTWYHFYKMSASRTQENENSYDHKIYIEINLENYFQKRKKIIYKT